MEPNRLYSILLLLVVETISLSLISCSGNHENAEVKNHELLAIEEARALIDLNDGLSAIDALEGVRLANPSDEYFITLASAHASAAGVVLKDYLSVTRLALVRAEQEKNSTTILTANLETLLSSNSVSDEDKAQVVDTFLFVQVLILTLEWIDIVDALPVPATKGSFDHLTTAIGILDEKLRVLTPGVAIYRGLLKTSRLRYEWVSGKFGVNLCEGEFARPVAAISRLLEDLADVVEDLGTVAEGVSASGRMDQIASGLREVSLQLQVTKQDLVWEVVDQLKSLLKDRNILCG